VAALMTRDFKGEGHSYQKVKDDDNSYTVGEFGGKLVVLVAPRLWARPTREISHEACASASLTSRTLSWWASLAERRS